MADAAERAGMLAIVREAWALAEAGPIAEADIVAIADGLLAHGTVPRRGSRPASLLTPPASPNQFDQAFVAGQTGDHP